MSNVTVTMLQSGRTDYWGRPLVAGSTYSLEFDLAKSLWQAGFASAADPAIFDDDNTPFDGGLIRYMRFPGFRKSLLAALVANTTASRSGGLVTVAATAHGITTGTTYVGFRFFYPGSANLVAGWYDSIVEVANANTLTFTAPGADFASESVNGAAAYTTLTSITDVIIPGGTLRPYSRITSNLFRSGDTTATTKNLRNLFGGNQLGLSSASTTPHGTHRLTIHIEDGLNRAYSAASQDGVLSNALTNVSIPVNVDQTFGISGSVSAAAGFLGLHNAPVKSGT